MILKYSFVYLVFASTMISTCLLAGANAWLTHTAVEHGPEDQTVVAGETVRFSCDLNFAARWDTIWWLFEKPGCFLYISRNDELRRSCGINMNHYTIEVDDIHHIYTIEIDNVVEEDAGTYICKNETKVLASARLIVQPRPVNPTSIVPAMTGECDKNDVCCEVSYYPTGLAPASEMEAQASCRWPQKYANVDIHVHLFCDDHEIRGANKVLLADRAIGKLELASSGEGCTNFTCNLEIVGESGVRDSCAVYSEEKSKQIAIKVDPEVNFVEEGLNAIFFCHIKNAPPTSGSFRWYIVQTHYTSTNTISSSPISSTNGFYGKLELSSVRLDDDFMSVQCFFEPDTRGANTSIQSNPALLRVIRRSRSHISCSTSSQSSLLECKDKGDTQGDDNESIGGLNIWPQSAKEWGMVVIILVLIIVVVFLACRSMTRKSPHGEHSREAYRNRPHRDNGDSVDLPNPPDFRYPQGRYEYLAERHYDAPYNLLRNIRNFPRRLRNHVIQRHYARTARQCHHDYANTDQTLSYGSLTRGAARDVRLRERVVSRPSEVTDDGGSSPRMSSDYDVLDACTMNVFFSQSPPTSPLPATPPNSGYMNRIQLESPVEEPESPITATPSVEPERPASSMVAPSVQTKGERPSVKRKPKVTPKPLSPTRPSMKIRQSRVPSISAEVDDKHDGGEECGKGGDPKYMNRGEVLGEPEGYTPSSATPSPVAGVAVLPKPT